MYEGHEMSGRRFPRVGNRTEPFFRFMTSSAATTILLQRRRWKAQGGAGPTRGERARWWPAQPQSSVIACAAAEFVAFAAAEFVA